MENILKKKFSINPKRNIICGAVKKEDKWLRAHLNIEQVQAALANVFDFQYGPGFVKPEEIVLIDSFIVSKDKLVDANDPNVDNENAKPHPNLELAYECIELQKAYQEGWEKKD